MSGKKGRKNDVPSNLNDRSKNAYSLDPGEVKVKPKTVDKPSKTPISSGIEDHRTRPKLFDKNQSAEPNPLNNVHKSEMQTLRLSKELENMMMDTLRFLYGENFALKPRSEYSDQGSNLGQKYWIDQGGLVVLGGVDYSQKNRKKTFAELNAFALSKLEVYGFHHPHCVEALEATDGDLGASLELLMIKYFNLNIPLPLKDSPKPPPTPSDIIEQRKDELCSLESIFEKSVEVRIADRVWVLKLDLPYLSELYPNTKVRNSDHHSSDTRRRGGLKDANGSKKGGKKNEICNAFAEGKVCKFGPKCRFLHKKPEVTSASKEQSEDNIFFLEIRFPPGCNYPLDVPVVCFSASASHFPPAVCLRLTSRLMKEARELSSQEIPSIYSLASLLQYQPEEILDFLQTIGEAFFSPNVSLFDASEEVQNGETKADDESRDDLYHSKDSSKRTRKISINIAERISADEKLIKKFSDKQRTERYKVCLKARSKLPAWNKMEEILDTVSRYQVVVISGETGCGKSTQVPQYLLDDWMLHFEIDGKKRCEIICTEPRRISAIGVAERVADERLDTVGNTVGYQIRLESKMSQSTRLLFCTTGILLRRLEREPDLQSVTHIVVDEVHERSEESDFLLMILKELLPKRPDLRVILMSATLDAKLFSDYFNKSPVINIPGRTFPVQKIFLDEILELTNYVLEEDSQYTRKLPKEKRKMDDAAYDGDSLDVQLVLADVNTNQSNLPKDKVRDEMLTLGQLQQRYSECSAQTIKTMYLMDVEKINYDLMEAVLTWIVDGDHDHPRQGSILVFLPGIAEIMTLHKQLTNHPLFGPRTDRFLLVPLHSTLTSEEQALVFRKCKEGVRKIVLSTNIAETSITIDDCVFVIDSGRMKEKRFDSNKNMESLEVEWVTRANAAQRRGRAGRVMPGVCIHLYSKYRHDFNFLEQPIPEIHRVPLEQLILRIKVLPNFEDRTVHQVICGIVEPPDVENIDTAIGRLQYVGALGSEQELTPLGHHLAFLPVDVRIGKLMLFGAMFCCVDAVLTIAACLSYKSPFVAPFAKRDEAQAKKKEFATGNSDHLTVLKAYTNWRKANSFSKRAGDVFAEENYLSWRTLVSIADIKHQFLELLTDIGFVPIELRRRKSGVDSVMDFTGTALNEHGENQKLLAAILCAALYPNLVKVLTPAKTFAPSVLGAIPRQLKPEELRFQTMHDGFVFVHPSSVTHSVNHFTSPYLVFTEKVKTSRIFIRDCSMVPMLPLVLFTGKPIKVELHRGTFVIALEEGWIMFSVESHQLADLLRIMREELKKLLEDKIKDPTLNLQQSPRGKKIINTIVALISQ